MGMGSATYGDLALLASVALVFTAIAAAFSRFAVGTAKYVLRWAVAHMVMRALLALLDGIPAYALAKRVIWESVTRASSDSGLFDILGNAKELVAESVRAKLAHVEL